MKPSLLTLLDRFRGGAKSVQPIEILLAGSRADDAARLSEIVANSRWKLAQVQEWDDVLRAQKQFGFPIVLYDRDLNGLRWREAVRVMMRSGGSPAIIMISNVADPYLWDDLVQAGGFDVLARPFRRDQTLAILEFAHKHWRTAVQKHA